MCRGLFFNEFYQKKGTATQEFFCKFCETFKNTLLYFIEHLRWLLLAVDFSEEISKYFNVYLVFTQLDLKMFILRSQY